MEAIPRDEPRTASRREFGHMAMEAARTIVCRFVGAVQARRSTARWRSFFANSRAFPAKREEHSPGALVAHRS